MVRINASQPRNAGRSPSRSTSSARVPRSSVAGFAVVGIGASAGGLEACTKFIDALPRKTDMAFILIQHLDPKHESMMVELLSSHTSMTVVQATEAMRLEPEHLYVIPPGTYLSLGSGAIKLSSRPPAHHGAHLPFDFLLESLAEEYSARGVCVILSGTGTDGSLGLKAVKEKRGLVIAQDPHEAGHDGMPRSAISTGAVDLVLQAGQIADALLNYNRSKTVPVQPGRPAASDPGSDPASDPLAAIIDLLRTRTGHDFTLYKRGTLRRRIERRMAMAGLTAGSMDRYRDVLRKDPNALDHLAKDLLINVTSFFRDPAVFELLERKTIPDLLAELTPGLPLRIWIAGCSTGEETYTLAMLFREQITASGVAVRLQVFASDVDPDAVAIAREGLYPDTIQADISPARLARFFSKDDRSYRVSAELRAAVVFTIQDVLVDPPFSRLDMVSCRNLLIYLGPEAQAKVISRFHFALREGGVLLLGSSETVGSLESQFKALSKPYRLYKHLQRSLPGEHEFSMNAATAMRSPKTAGARSSPAHQNAFGDLCRKLVLETYAPAAALVNSSHECLYTVGPIERYLRVASGHATHDLLSMAPQGFRTKLRSAIQKASHENARVTIAGGLTSDSVQERSFKIDIQPVLRETEQLLLVCFVDEPRKGRDVGRSTAPGDAPRVAELEQELETTRIDLQGAIRDLEVAAEEQKTINEEALSVNEEYQSTNEELLTSKEEMQSLNEELTALNSQLQETLERQRTTSNDLQNILYSTNVATLFLDTHLNIRFFTPATKVLFSVIPGDIGRPLADLSSLSAGNDLSDDARAVLSSLEPLDREIETTAGSWFTRRILPYRTHDHGVDGVVITFTDITERKRAARALEAAKQQAESASVAKSRFLAAASHDLRQPLQTLTLLGGLLAKTMQSDQSNNLVGRLDQAVSAMAGMLNALLDINQIEAGVVRAEMVDFHLTDLFERLRDEFTYHAKARGLALHVVSSGLAIHSDPRLLEQMLRNLLSNALKYTRHGRVLLGCRRHQGRVSIEVWDTGIGIPGDEILAIFEEYHQLDNAARERAKGLGLGLSIVQRLGTLLGHRVHVHSRPGKGSVFAIDVMLAPAGAVAVIEPDRTDAVDRVANKASSSASILIVEDDPAIRDLLDMALVEERYHVAAAHDGVDALALLNGGGIRPDLILTDFNLPNGQNGLQLARNVRTSLGHAVPVIILTGDISTDTLRDIALQHCARLAKPVKLKQLTQLIQQLLAAGSMPTMVSDEPASTTRSPAACTVFIIDDDSQVCEALGAVIERTGKTVQSFPTSEAFLDSYRPGDDTCLLVDASLPGIGGLELLKRLRDAGDRLPTIVITGNGDVHMAVRAMKAGASDFIEKPVGPDELLAGIERALSQARDSTGLSAWRASAASHVADLTPRQRQIMDSVLAGHPSKNIAVDLGISQRTVENHRASIMKKTGTKSLPALARLALAAAWDGADEPASQSRPPAKGRARTSG